MILSRPTGGEIDIFEMVGDPLEDDIWTSYHWAATGQCGADKAPIPGKGVKPAGQPPMDWQTEWHIYEVQWYADRLEFYLDATLVMTRLAADVGMPTAPMHVIFDQAVDQTIFSPTSDTRSYHGDGVVLRVAWVRAYVTSDFIDI